MDGRHFDELSKALAARGSRRRLLKGLAAGLLGGLARIRSPQPGAAAPQSCDPDLDRQACRDACRAIYQGELRACQKDFAAAVCIRAATQKWLRCLRVVCGLGPEACPPFTQCSNGLCCPSGQTGCGGACVANTCSGDQVFNPAACRCECPAGTEACFPGCAPFCPRCVAACGATEVYDPGACACGCAPGLTSCGDVAGSAACVDTATDPTNCGGCGIACAAGQTCVGGQCECQISCPEGQAPNPGNGCQCECAEESLACCPEGQEECGGQCVDICPAGRLRNTTCGCDCAVSCPEGQTPNSETCACECSGFQTGCAPHEVCQDGICTAVCLPGGGGGVHCGTFVACEVNGAVQCHCNSCGTVCNYSGGQACCATGCRSVVTTCADHGQC